MQIITKEIKKVRRYYGGFPTSEIKAEHRRTRRAVKEAIKKLDFDEDDDLFVQTNGLYF